MIPKSFKIANQSIQVVIQDSLTSGDYGNWSDARNIINIAKTIEEDHETIELSEEQMENTFYHELFHAFQYYYNNKYDEAQAQVFANFMREYLSTQKLD